MEKNNMEEQKKKLKKMAKEILPKDYAEKSYKVQLELYEKMLNSLKECMNVAAEKGLLSFKFVYHETELRLKNDDDEPDEYYERDNALITAIEEHVKNSFRIDYSSECVPQNDCNPECTSCSKCTCFVFYRYIATFTPRESRDSDEESVDAVEDSEHVVEDSKVVEKTQRLGKLYIKKNE